jgi:hypothetical protein
MRNMRSALTTTPVQENGNNQTTPSYAVPIVVLGTDAMLAALPATPVQLAHACLRAGFANVIPVSWGDELIAAAMLRRLAPHGGPAIQCSCPKVAHRLLSVGSDLRPVMVPLVSPPVAAARYIRSVSQPTRTRITYVGACPGAIDDAIDIRMSPEALLSMLAERDIIAHAQPRVFEGVIPPDRRRFRSQPGGLPSADALWSESGSRTLVEIEGDDMPAEIAQHLLSGRTVLIDASARLGCVCAGAVSGVEPKDARAQVVAHEPPRATTPVVNDFEPIELDLSVPAASRAPADVVAAVESATQSPPPSARFPESNASSTAAGYTPPAAHPATQPPSAPPRITPTPGMSTFADPRSGRQTPPTAPPRPVFGSVPVARGTDGKALPRAYIARRRSPRGHDLIPPRAESTPPDSATPENLESELMSGETEVPEEMPQEPGAAESVLEVTILGESIHVDSTQLESASFDSPTAQPTPSLAATSERAAFELTAPEPAPVERAPLESESSEPGPTEDSQLSMSLAEPEDADSAQTTPVDLLELPPPETLDESVGLESASAIAVAPSSPLSLSDAVRQGHPEDHHPSFGPLSPMANLTLGRRSLWLIVLLVVAVIAGIAAGVAIARSFSDPPTASSKR